MRVRRLGWLLASIPSVALLACFGSTDNSTGLTPPEVDASPMDTSSPAPEASVAEAGTDSAEEPSPSPFVTVVVLGPSGPEAGKTIVFSDATGAVVTTATTDASGTVVQTLPAGSQATALLGTPDSPQLVTVVGVQPGDTLTAVDGVASQVAGEVLVTVHGSAPATTNNYSVSAGNCGAFLSSGSSVDLDVSGCTNSAGQFPLLAVARANDGDLAYSFEKPNALGTDGGPTSIVMTGNWYFMGTETVSVTGTVASDDWYVSYNEVAAGVSDIQNQTYYEPLSDDAGVPPMTFESHPLYPDFVQTELSAYDSQPGVGMATAIATRTAAPTGSASFDGSDLLPILTSASVDSTDPTRPSVGWTAAAPLTGAVGTIAEMFWYDQGAGQSGSWTIVAPSSTTSVQVPVLPSTATSLAPGANSVWDSTPTVAAIGGGDLVDYAAFRRGAGQLATQLQPNPTPTVRPITTPTIPLLTSDGTMKVTLTYEVLESE
jgi:hypothetical protein